MNLGYSNVKGRGRSIDFAPGVTRLLGQNGCGKTSVITALNLALGGKDPVIGAQKARLQTLSKDGGPIKAWLTDGGQQAEFTLGAKIEHSSSWNKDRWNAFQSLDVDRIVSGDSKFVETMIEFMGNEAVRQAWANRKDRQKKVSAARKSHNEALAVLKDCATVDVLASKVDELNSLKGKRHQLSLALREAGQLIEQHKTADPDRDKLVAEKDALFQKYKALPEVESDDDNHRRVGRIKRLKESALFDMLVRFTCTEEQKDELDGWLIDTFQTTDLDGELAKLEEVIASNVDARRERETILAEGRNLSARIDRMTVAPDQPLDELNARSRSLADEIDKQAAEIKKLEAHEYKRSQVSSVRENLDIWATLLEKAKEDLKACQTVVDDFFQVTINRLIDKANRYLAGIIALSYDIDGDQFIVNVEGQGQVPLRSLNLGHKIAVAAAMKIAIAAIDDTIPLVTIDDASNMDIYLSGQFFDNIDVNFPVIVAIVTDDGADLSIEPWANKS